MSGKIEELIEAVRALEKELEEEFRRKREEFRFTVEARRIRFGEDLVLQQRRLKVGVARYLREARPQVVLVVPIIYVGIVPLLLLDLFVAVYQAICFPIYGIPKTRRGDYLIFDRDDLPYLNALEKIQCGYCSYANGLAAWFREVAARTEQYWCPIKYARKIRDAHSRYPHFFEYGDAESFRKGLERLRKEYEESGSGE
jgi:hypothetical protein